MGATRLAGVPEGDTILRAAKVLHEWLAGREITAARTTASAVPAHKLVGQRVVAVEARAKHLLVRFDSGMVLHSHMRMTGSWHTYAAGEKWRKPASQARLVLEAGDRIAVCFNAPVVELLAKRGEEVHPALTTLGPDVLVDPLDLDEVRRRLADCPPETAIGQVLLDQRVVSGIGNIWRNEALFACRIHPATPWSQLDPGDIDNVVSTAARLMRANVEGRRSPQHVYRRAGRPCPRCRTRIVTATLGDPPRSAYWCPNCQGSVLKS